MNNSIQINQNDLKKIIIESRKDISNFYESIKKTSYEHEEEYMYELSEEEKLSLESAGYILEPTKEELRLLAKDENLDYLIQLNNELEKLKMYKKLNSNSEYHEHLKRGKIKFLNIINSEIQNGKLNNKNYFLFKFYKFICERENSKSNDFENLETLKSVKDEVTFLMLFKNPLNEPLVIKQISEHLNNFGEWTTEPKVRHLVALYELLKAKGYLKTIYSNPKIANAFKNKFKVDFTAKNFQPTQRNEAINYIEQFNSLGLPMYN